MKKIFTLFISLFIALSLSAYDFRSGDLFYNITSSSEPYTVEVACALSSITTATIPRTVTYNGTIYSVTSIGYPAFYMCESLTSVTIPNGVTNIGNSVFYGCSSLTSITIPNSVTSIGDDAFYDCDGLTSITIPNSVTSIGNYAFLNCDGLTSITIPNNITSIGQEVFSSCSSLTSVVWNAKSCADFSSYYDAPFYYIKSQITSFSFGDDVEYIPADLCSGMSKLISITIPNSVTSIGNYAFYGCSGLTSLTIPNSVTSIGQSAFYGCSGLTSVTLGNSVTSIGKDAFFDCDGLTSITIPNSVTSIGESAFSNCNSLTSLVWNAKSCDDFQNPFDTYDCKITSLTIGESVQDIPEYLCSYMGKLTSVVWNVKSYDDFLEYGDSPFSDYNPITSFTFGESVQHIPAYLCSGLDNLTSVTIGSNVTSIGNNAFYGCDALTSITIPNSVTSIGNQAFADCFSLTSITIPNSVTSIGDAAFLGSSSLDTIYVEATTPPALGSGVFTDSPVSTCIIPCGTKAAYEASDWAQYISEFVEEDCVDPTWQILYTSTDGNIVLPYKTNVFGANIVSNTYENGVGTITFDGPVTSIGDRAFSSCTSLTSVTLPNSVTSIGDRAFSSCTSLTSVTLPNSVTSIGDEAFWYCSSLTSITIPNSVTSIGELAFNGCSSLTSITIPNSVTSIGDGVFNNCSSLTSVVWNVKSCAEFAEPYYAPFDDICTQITSFTFGDDVEYVPAYLCCGMSNLSSITIPNSVKSIGNRAFAACSSLTSITIPNTVTSIEEYAFLNCSSLTSVVWNVKSCAEFAEPYYAPFDDICTQITSFTFGDDVEYVPAYLCCGMSNLSSITIPNSVKSIGNRAFAACSSLTSITIPNTVTSIEEYAFLNCSSLTSLTIPNSVTSIGKSALENCSSLTSITIGNNLPSIGDDVFKNCSSLTSVVWNVKNCAEFASYYDGPFYNICTQITSFTIGDDVEYIPAYLCSYMINLSSVTISNSVTRIGVGAFFSCSSLTSITIPNSVTSIGEDAFFYCSSLTSITIPNSVTSIENRAFYKCNNLTSVTISNNVESIGYRTFYDCTSLASITIPNSVTSIGEEAFYDCTSLTSVTIPNSVTSIGEQAFYNCSSLDTIYVEATIPPTLSGHLLFYGTPSSLCYIPCGTLAVYEASDWANYMGEFVEVCPAVVKAKVPASWEDDDITVWVWTDGAGTEYPTTKEGDWYVYTHTDDTEFNIIFKSGTGWKGNTYQTVDIDGITENTCLEIQPTNIKATYTIVDCPSIIYELNGGVTNDYDWMSKDDMYHELLVDINAIMPTTKVDVDTVTLAYDKTKNIQEGIPTYWGSLDSLLTNFDFLSKWSWLINYMDSTCVLESKLLPSTSSAYLRFNLSAFFIEKERTAWPTTPDYSKYGLYSYYQPAWQHGFANPTNPMGDFILNAPYREGYTFAGWYTTPDFSGDKVTTINAETEGTLYAKWIDETWVIKYTSIDGNIVTPNDVNVFGANIVSNTYENGVGTITFDGPVTSIGDEAFNSCSFLTSITIPESVMSIGRWAFCQCDALTSIAIPDGVTSIGDYAFRNCTSLTSITIPNSVTNIGRWVFAFGSSLTSIVVEKNNTTYDSRNNCNAIIETATNTLVAGCHNTIIPNSVTSIGSYAFAGCSSLLSITIPDGVTSIGDWAFRNCTSLTSITIPNSITSIGYYAFLNCSYLDSIYVEATTPPALEDSTVFMNTPSPVCVIPCGTLAAYEASDWAQYVSEFIEEGCISFELNGGVVSAELPIYIASSYTLPTPTREGYIFRGWYDNPQGIGNRLSTLPAGYEGTIYAYWTKEPTDALNPFAYALSSELSQDNSQLLINYSLNARAMDVQIVIMDGETAVKTIACNGILKGSHSIAIPTAGLPEHKQLTWKVEVKGAEVTEPTEYAVNYSFYHPSAVDIDNNPENPTFGMILTNEGMHKVKDIEGYLSTGYGAGIYAFNPAFEPMPNGSNPGYNGGVEFTDKRADAPDSITNGYTAYSPYRIRISEDGRIFVTSLNTDGNYLWEVNPNNLDEWTPVFQGTLNDNKELVDAGGNFIAAPNIGFDVKGTGEDLQLMMYSANLSSITSAAMGGFRCDEYNLGTATSWATAPSKVWENGKYIRTYLGTQVVYDNEGGIWIASYRGTATNDSPGLVHINKDGVEDLKLLWNNLRRAGIRFNNDFTKLVVAGNNGAPKKATIYAVSKDANGAPVLTEETVIDMAILGNNINDFAFDYAGNLYACSNSLEKIVAWAMPRSADDIVTTPAASKYSFIYSDDAITYELNGGVTNDYGWQSKADMWEAFKIDAGITTLASLDELKAAGEGSLSTICTPLGASQAQAILDNPKWDWLEAYIMNHQNADAAATKLTEGTSSAGWRYALAAFFLESQRTGWPKSADFSKAGKDEAYIPTWRHAFDNPTNPAEEFVLNIPYREGYTFAGWYTNADFSGEKVTTINAETEGTLYAKWIDETWVIKYTSTDGNIVTPHATDVFGANIVSNTYENGVGTITFDGPVTSIGENAFAYSCDSLVSIMLPNTVTTIGSHAFISCAKLITITLSDNLASIGEWAFCHCPLRTIILPNTLESIGSNAFRYTNLQSIIIPKNVVDIDNSLFFGCTSLKSIIVDGENPIYDSREDCNAIIETATNTLIAGCWNSMIPNSVVSIGDAAFVYCHSLTSITIPNSVVHIGDGAFCNCGISSITIPSSVNEIEGNAFVYCDYLSSITVDVNNTTYDSRNNCNAIMETETNTLVTGCKNTIIPNDTKIIGEMAFQTGGIQIDTLVIPNGVTSIERQAFYLCEKLEYVRIPNTVTYIGYAAFCGCDTLSVVQTDAILPPLLGEDGWGTHVFETYPNCVIPCGTLAAYEASDWASQVGSFVEECVEGQQITYTSTNDSIVTPYDVNAFDANIVSNVYENGVGTITFDGPLTRIGTQAFHDCFTLTSIIVPNSVKIIGNAAFSGTYLESVVIGSGVTSIGEDVFGGCGLLTSIVVDTNNTTFDSREDCNAIIKTSNNILVAGCKTTVIPNTIKGIGNYAFAGSWEMTSIEIPDGVETIGSSAFGGCTVLRSVLLPNSLVTIGDDAFSTCPALTSITIPSSVKRIGADAFWCDYALDTIFVEATTPPILGHEPFHSAPVSHCFIPCGTLAAYEASDWASQVGSFVEDCVEGQQIYYTSTDGNIVTPNKTYVFGANIVSNEYKDGQGVITFDGPVTSIGDSAFYQCKSLASITIPNSVTSIGKRAFHSCYSLTSVTIPNSVTSIGNDAFYDCDGLISITIPNSVTSIGGFAFGACSSITSITIPNSVVSIKNSAFAYCSSLISISIPSSVTSIGERICEGCSSLISIVVEESNKIYDSRMNCNAIIETATNTLVAGCQNTIIPHSVMSIGDAAFSECSSLNSIIIPNSVTTLGCSAFYGCVSLTSIGIPSSITKIGVSAFSGCYYLDTIYVEAINPPSLGAYIFYGNPSPVCVIPCGTLAAYEASDWASQVGSFLEDCVEGQQIYYTSTDGNIVTPNVNAFDANIVSNIYENGVGTITFDGPITIVGDSAFHECTTLTSITIPNGVTIIKRAFEKCTSLESIELPDGITTIGDIAFHNCSSLRSIDIPNSVTYIGGWAFGASAIESLIIPSSVTHIGVAAFTDCNSLRSIVVEDGNPNYDSRNNCNAIIETATNTLIASSLNTIIPNTVTTIATRAFQKNAITSIDIPNSVVRIEAYAFRWATQLNSITIPNSVNYIGDSVFYSCPLDTIRMEAMTPPTIGVNPFSSSPVCVIPCGSFAAYNTFVWASQVSEFVEEGCAPIQMCGDDLYWEYADGVLTITGTGDMYDYAADTDVPWHDVRGNIKTVILPDAMTKIGQNAFYKCTEVTSINMPTTLTAIGEKAFAQDTKLACEIILPASMTTIASRAFFNCQAVTAFHIEATTPPTIPNDAFERTTAPIHVPCGYGHVYGKHAQWGELNLEMCELLQDNVYYYPIDGHTARAVTYYSNPTDTIVIPSAVVIDGMPRTVTEVADFAFMDCANLPAIYFSEGLEYIGERAFVRCYGLQGTIVLPATLETIGERAFSYCNNVDRYTIQAMTPPVLGANAFTGDNKNALFYISCEAMDDYTVATNWSSLKSRLRDACLNIYHYNTALGANGVHTTEDTLVASIYYRRKFTPYRWETLYLPFEVDRVTVLEDGVEYDLTAWDIVYGGHYFLAKPDGMLNKEILFGFTDELESHTPYIIQFSDAYYTDKLITFYGKESWNKLSTSFEVLSSSAWMQIAGNTTLQDQLLEKPVYMLRSGLDFILQKTTTTLHPFECYVMPYATPSGTPARMNVRFRGDVPTAVESVKGNESHLTYTVDGYTLTVYPQGQAFSIYSLNGALIYSCEAGKEAVDCELNSGCYLLHAGTEAHKIML